MAVIRLQRFASCLAPLKDQGRDLYSTTRSASLADRESGSERTHAVFRAGARLAGAADGRTKSTDRTDIETLVFDRDHPLTIGRTQHDFAACLLRHDVAPEDRAGFSVVFDPGARVFDRECVMQLGEHAVVEA